MTSFRIKHSEKSGWAVRNIPYRFDREHARETIPNSPVEECEREIHRIVAIKILNSLYHNMK